MLAAEREDEVKELASKLHQERMDGIWKHDMLHYVIDKNSDLNPDDVGISNEANDANGNIALITSLLITYH